MYDQQFIQVLEEGDLYSGEAKYAGLRFLYKEIIDSIKHIGVLENNTWLTVQLTKVDEDYIRDQVTNFLEDEERVEEYSKEEIIKSILKHTDRINSSISKDVKDAEYAYSIGVPRVFTQYTVAELRAKNLLG